MQFQRQQPDARLDQINGLGRRFKFARNILPSVSLLRGSWIADRVMTSRNPRNPTKVEEYYPILIQVNSCLL
jgi:hypothetical protein